MNMYYLALIAPDDVDRQVLIWKNRMKDLYQSVVALRSPAHITLIPPFWMNEELEPELIDSIHSFSKTQISSTINMNGFSCFKPSVIFADVLVDHWITELKHALENSLISKNRFPIKKDTRAFHPHITIATRDLHKKQFEEAWKYFENKDYSKTWMANGISLLRHNKKNWDVIFTSQF
jgi:2'-5' RNA ligase